MDMYHNVRQIDAVHRIDSIIEQTKVRTRNQKEEVASTFDNNPKPKDELTTKETLQKITMQANEALEVVNTQLVFQVHEGTGRPLIRLVESATQEVIREIPSEKMLDVLAGIWEWAGLIVDRKE